MWDDPRQLSSDVRSSFVCVRGVNFYGLAGSGRAPGTHSTLSADTAIFCRRKILWRGKFRPIRHLPASRPCGCYQEAPSAFTPTTTRAARGFDVDLAQAHVWPPRSVRRRKDSHFVAALQRFLDANIGENLLRRLRVGGTSALAHNKFVEARSHVASHQTISREPLLRCAAKTSSPRSRRNHRLSSPIASCPSRSRRLTSPIEDVREKSTFRCSLV